MSLCCTEYLGEMLCVHEANIGSNFTSHWEAVSSTVFFLCRLWEKSGWHSIYCGCNKPNSLHRGLSQVGLC